VSFRLEVFGIFRFAIGNAEPAQDDLELLRLVRVLAGEFDAARQAIVNRLEDVKPRIVVEIEIFQFLRHQILIDPVIFRHIRNVYVNHRLDYTTYRKIRLGVECQDDSQQSRLSAGSSAVEATDTFTQILPTIFVIKYCQNFGMRKKTYAAGIWKI
jgi:hypothetical protein